MAGPVATATVMAFGWTDLASTWICRPWVPALGVKPLRNARTIALSELAIELEIGTETVVVELSNACAKSVHEL